MNIRQKYSEEELRGSQMANAGRLFQQCAVSVLDTISHPEIRFNEDGVSQYVALYDEQSKHLRLGSEGKRAVEECVKEMKAYGAKRKYDCLLGISGGVDSTYLALVAKRLGLRVLCVHFDNGWN
ncbi:MAG: hypothetical protein OSA37_09920 [Flavobacteriales bacterium]|nr:hypothetical protein [Flavobacteriales bacterium]